MTPYRDYTQAVCSCLRHATAEEKQAVAQELQDHLADHADALVEAGWDPEEAQAHALAAMGEAQEVGQALNRASLFGGSSSPGCCWFWRCWRPSSSCSPSPAGWSAPGTA